MNPVVMAGEDPGKSFLYNSTRRSPARFPEDGRAQLTTSVSPSRVYTPTRADSGTASEPGHLTANGQPSRWDAAVQNVGGAQAALNVLAQEVDSAVYLGDDEYNQVAPKVAYVKTIQAQQARIAKLMQDMRNLQSQLTAAEEARRQSDALRQEVEQELENNSSVFKLHFNEILSKNEEIQRLQAVIEGLAR